MSKTWIIYSRMMKKKLKYPPEFKKEVCDYAKKESIFYASILYSIHRNTISSWVKKYKNSGVTGFIVKRNDTQVTKLDKKTLSKIACFKRNNPDSSLLEIKEKYNLDCHISLISRKLKKVSVPVKNKRQNEVLFLRTKIIREADHKDTAHPVFRISLHICSGKPIAVGFTNTYNSEKICLFIRYALEKLKMIKKCGDFKKIVTSAKFIKSNDFTSIVGLLGDYELETVSSKEYQFCGTNDIELSRKNLKYSLADTYDKILADYDLNELNEALLVSLVNINELSKDDVSKNKWDTLYLPAETKKSLYAALEKIRDKGNKAVMDFDYDTARNEYHKAYTALTVLNVEDKELKLSVLKAKAMLYYNTEKYQTALMLFRDITRFAKAHKIEKEFADSYFYIAMIYRNFQNITGAVRYFRLSAKTVNGKDAAMLKCLYYRAKFNEYLIQNKNQKAEQTGALYYESALNTKNKELIGSALSARGACYYTTGKYEIFEKMLIEAKDYNLKNENYYEASKNLTNLLSIYSRSIIRKECDIELILSELKTVTDKINIPHLYYDSVLRSGIYYYNISQKNESRKKLEYALPGVKKYLGVESYLNNLCYLGRIYYETNEIGKASKNFIIAKQESAKRKIYEYLLYANHYIVEIYLQKEDFKRAINIIKKSILYSHLIKNSYYCGDFHLFYAKIYEKRSKKNLAMDHYKEALKYFESMNQSNDLSSEILKINAKITEYN
jgi:transposase